MNVKVTQEYEAEIRERIKTFWPKLDRQLTTANAQENAKDSKSVQDDKPVIFLPNGSSQLEYYKQDTNLLIKTIPKLSEINDDFIFEVSRNPGILALAFDANNQPLHYAVPGGRFNEFYGWDSYFIARGLLNDGNVELACAIADHFSFEIYNYGKILNANRPYYLGRTQPPFLSDLAWKLLEFDNTLHTKFFSWITAAITEYHNVWMSSPRYDPTTKLSKYSAQGRGIPPEVEEGHFDSVLKPYAERHGLSIKQFMDEYNYKRIKEPELDRFFKNDRAVRESGHDVTSRFANVCAELVTIDLCALLYKYEVDIARAIERFPTDFPNESYKIWYQRAEQRKQAADKYLWSDGVYCDFNVQTGKQHKPVVSATTLFPLWSGMASKEQAAQVKSKGLPLVEFEGGVSSTSELDMSKHKGHQWDYPAGWAPHQLLAWEGLANYGFNDDANRLAQKWIKTVCQGAIRSGGGVYEKYDVRGVTDPQDVRAEYGNQGNSETGFGWTNATYAIAYDHYRI